MNVTSEAVWTRLSSGSRRRVCGQRIIPVRLADRQKENGEKPEKSEKKLTTFNSIKVCRKKIISGYIWLMSSVGGAEMGVRKSMSCG